MIVGGNAVRFQIILFETSNEILFQYDDVETDGRTRGNEATIGILDKEERMGGIGYSYNQAILSNNLAIRFRPVPQAGHLTLDDVTLANNNADENEGGGFLTMVWLLFVTALLQAIPPKMGVKEMGPVWPTATEP